MENKEYRHPEQKENEILVINLYDHEPLLFEGDPNSPFLTSRRGEVAYKTNSFDVVPDMKPMFAVLKPTIKNNN